MHNLRKMLASILLIGTLAGCGQAYRTSTSPCPKLKLCHHRPPQPETKNTEQVPATSEYAEYKLDAHSVLQISNSDSGHERYRFLLNGKLVRTEKANGRIISVLFPSVDISPESPAIQLTGKKSLYVVITMESRDAIGSSNNRNDGKAYGDDGKAYGDDGNAYGDDGNAYSDDGNAYSDDGNAYSDAGNAYSDAGNGNNAGNENDAENGNDAGNEVTYAIHKVSKSFPLVAQLKVRSHLTLVKTTAGYGLEGQDLLSGFGVQKCSPTVIFKLRNGKLSLDINEMRKRAPTKTQLQEQRKFIQSKFKEENDIPVELFDTVFALYYCGEVREAKHFFNSVYPRKVSGRKFWWNFVKEQIAQSPYRNAIKQLTAQR